MIYHETLDVFLNDYKKVGNCTLYIVLFAAFLVTSTVISTVFGIQKIFQRLITSINEESQTIQYKKPSKLFF